MSTKLTDEEKINLIEELAQADMISFQRNILGEMEIMPIGFSRDSWYWLLNEKYDLDEKSIPLMNQLILHMQEKGIRLNSKQK